MTGILLGPRSAAAAGGGVVISDMTVMGTNIAVYRLLASGYIAYHDGTGLFYAGPWIYPQTGMELYEAGIVAADGDPLQIADPAGDWVPCSSSPQWGYSHTLPKMGTITVQIRRISDAVVVAEANIYLEIAGGGGGGGGGGDPLP